MTCATKVEFSWVAALGHSHGVKYCASDIDGTPYVDEERTEVHLVIIFPISKVDEDCSYTEAQSYEHTSTYRGVLRFIHERQQANDEAG